VKVTSATSMVEKPRVVLPERNHRVRGGARKTPGTKGMNQKDVSMLQWMSRHLDTWGQVHAGGSTLDDPMTPGASSPHEVHGAGTSIASPLVASTSTGLDKWGSKSGNCTTQIPSERNAFNQFTWVHLPDFQYAGLFYPRAFQLEHESSGQRVYHLLRAGVIILCVVFALRHFCSRRINLRKFCIPQKKKEQQMRGEEDCDPEVSESMDDLPDNMAEAWIDVSSQSEHCQADESEKKAIAKGDRVFVDGRAATIVYGPDIDGEYMVRFDDDEKKSGFLKADSIQTDVDYSAMVALEPQDSIHFSSEGSGSLSVSNLSSGHVAFRLQATSPKRYHVRPARMTLGPKEHRVVEICSKLGGANIKDRFLVMVAPVRSSAKLTVDDWKQIPRNVIAQHGLSITKTPLMTVELKCDWTVAESPQKPSVQVETFKSSAVRKMKVTEIPAMDLLEADDAAVSAGLFKVGDRVSSLLEYDIRWSGLGYPWYKQGEIIEADSSDHPYRIQFDDGDMKWYKEGWIEASEEEIESYEIENVRCSDDQEETATIAEAACLAVPAQEQPITDDPPSASLQSGIKKQNATTDGSYGLVVALLARVLWPTRYTKGIDNKAAAEDMGEPQPTLDSVWLGLSSLESFMQGLGWLTCRRIV